MEYVEASSNKMDIKIELSVLRNPRKHYSRLHPRTTHTPTQERYEKAFRRSVPPAGHHLHTFIVNGNLRLQKTTSKKCKSKRIPVRRLKGVGDRREPFKCTHDDYQGHRHPY